jgi:xylan 1,4-beta-xylosidase
VSAESSAQVPLDEIVKSGVRSQPDVGSLASLDGHRLAVMLWHYHDDDVPGPAANVTLRLTGLPMQSGTARVTEYRIDETHSNAYSAWKTMGSPQQPTRDQVAALVKAGQLEQTSQQQRSVSVHNHSATLTTVLPRQGVSLIIVDS